MSPAIGGRICILFIWHGRRCCWSSDKRPYGNTSLIEPDRSRDAFQVQLELA